jgi:LysM repeat protein
MRVARQVIPGLLIALVSILLTVGGLALSFAEANLTMPTRTRTEPATPTATRITLTPEPLTPTAPTLTATLTLSPTPTGCPLPQGWVIHILESGEDLETLASRHNLSVEFLRQANCLSLPVTLQVGMEVFVPADATQTAGTCGPPPGWVTYPVQPGDNLYRLSVAYGVTVQALQSANCMGSSTLLVVGKLLYVPPWAPTPPTPTYPYYYYTETPTWTVIVPETPTDTPTPSDTP